MKTATELLAEDAPQQTAATPQQTLSALILRAAAARQTGKLSHAQGVGTKAEAYGSFSTDGYTTAKGSYSHAEGYGSTTNGSYAHAEGYYTTATGSNSHTEGNSTLTEGYSAHTEGYATNARAPYSHSKGYFTVTKSNSGSHIMGLYGDADTPYSWFLGGGTSSARAMAAKILYTGDGYIRNV